MDENKDLLNEIDSLDDDHVVETKTETKKETKKEEPAKEPIVEKNNGAGKVPASSTAILVGILTLVLVVGLVVKYNTNKANGVMSGNKYGVKNFLNDLKGEDVDIDVDIDENGEDIDIDENDSFLGGFLDGIFDIEDDDDEDYNENYTIYTDEDEQKAKEEFKAQKQNISFEDLGLNVDKELMFKVTNANDKNIEDLRFCVVFYDAERNIVGIEEENIYLFSAHQDRYISIYNTPENYEAYDVAILKDYYFDNGYVSYVEKIEARFEEENGESYLCVKNNSDKKIEEIDVTVIYYSADGKVIGIEPHYFYELRKGKETEEEIYGIYSEEENQYIDYANKAVVVDEAYIY